ncbi:MAG: hypothetical protein BWY82_02315 [Verrucomicrobia bacterium ADurb.Bin474]|nr:MAG: hypothetical protein BWY82_02315 [Verrucomicrobia bacterium ADurb.Bin474]
MIRTIPDQTIANREILRLMKDPPAGASRHLESLKNVMVPSLRTRVRRWSRESHRVGSARQYGTITIDPDSLDMNGIGKCTRPSEGHATGVGMISVHLDNISGVQ